MTAKENSQVPIFVDLDGTLVKTDIAQELLLQSFKKWSNVKRLCSLAAAGRSHIKRMLAEENDFAAENLPYNQEVIDYLKTQKANGRKLILATASDEIIASKVAEHLAIFDDVIASTPGNNLKGKNKLEAIQAYCQDGGFEYLGDNKVDYPIWKAAERSGFINAPKPASRVEKEASKVALEVNNKPSAIKTLIKAMRPHQWAKNVLVFVPLIFSHQYTDINLVVLASITFFLFSFSASGIYLINDLLDIEDDRAHKKKSKRPFAAGLMLPLSGVIWAVVLVSLPLIFSAVFLSYKVSLVIIAYLILTNLYSFYLKHYSTIDVITLTCLYTIRIVGGGVAVSVYLSPWLLNFSLFFFLSLAYMKRYIELSNTTKSNKLSGRNYTKDEMDVVMTTGIVNGGLAVLTLSMFLNSEDVASRYASPQLLWFICPLFLFWIYRAWMWAKREKIDDDPVVFALKDRISLVTVSITGVLIVASKFISVSTLMP